MLVSILQYVLLFIIVIIIFFFLFIRIKYRFWAIQPVFHFYDLYYWIVNVGVIREELPEKNRYTNFKNIKTISFDILNDQNIKDFTLLVQLNYLRNNENTFTPKKGNIIPYFQCHNHKSFWSFYWQPDTLIDNKTNATIDHEKLIGVITSRPLHVTFLNNIKKIEIDVYYVDYLCVDKSHRKKNIASQLIQTHEYNQSYLNRKICVSLFKREEDLTGIIPLTVYKTFCFNMKNWLRPLDLDPRIKLLHGDKQNIYYLYNFINEMKYKNKWDLTVLPDMSNLIELVVTQNIFICMLVINTTIVASYIFKKTCTFIEKEKEIISCISSINNDTLTNNDFIQGFKISLWSIIDKPENKNFKYLIVEDISDNCYIIANISKKTHPIAVSPCAYFFYNFAYSPFKSNNILIVN
jgi:ribosomal protein S18 acetylase RimI-like enzyme